VLGKYAVKTKVPTHVDLELSSYCNLRCTMCPHGSDDLAPEMHLMDYELAKKVIREASEYGVSSLKFSGRGEVTMHPQFSELVKYAKSLNILDVMFNTNALRLNEKMARAVVDAGIDLAIISIDGATKETYEKIRIKGNFEKLVKNIEYLISYRNKNKSSKPLIRLQFVKMKENIHEFESFKKMWERKADVLVGLDYSNRTEDEDGRSIKVRAPDGRDYCPHPWRRLTVTSTGKVLMCCADWDMKYVVGDCKKEDIVQIWNGPRIEYARARIKDLEHDKINSCKSCFAPISYKWKTVTVDNNKCDKEIKVEVTAR
jgi:radical SAM protein with 4Fe4S-binding SPASM domain